MDHGIPSTKEELERKTIDLLLGLTHRADAMRMEKSELALVGRQLWNVTSGLVSAEVSDLCAQVAGYAGSEPAPMVRRFIGNGCVVVVSWLPDSDGCSIVKTDATALTAKITDSPVDIARRPALLQTLFAGLCAQGYRGL